VKEQTGVPITGVSAKIVTRSVTLCQEGVVAGNDGKSSNAHVTVLDPVNTDDSDFWYWAQTGYVKIQNPNEATVKRYVFAELKVPEALPNDWQTDVHPDPNQPTLNDFHQYQCKKLVGTDGNWYYHYDDEQNSWKMLNHAAWMNHTGKRAKWGAEITNKEDGMVGVKNGNECVFKEIKAASQYNAFFAPNITPGDLKSDDINEWKIKKRVSPGNDEIEIWDETP
jgi:hypothetical protein